MRLLHSTPGRFAIGAAFLALVALGATLAGLEPIAFVALLAVAVVLAALVERAYASKAGRARIGSSATAESPCEDLPPPVREHQLRKPEPPLDPEPKPGREPEVEPESNDPRSEWNIWELQRLVRERPDDDRQEEWTAMILSLRDFARVDGTLPSEFDSLVRDAFGTLLVENGVRSESAAAP